MEACVHLSQSLFPFIPFHGSLLVALVAGTGPCYVLANGLGLQRYKVHMRMFFHYVFFFFLNKALIILGL